MSNIVKVGDEKQLFIDDRWFFTQHGLTLRVNAPVKSKRVLLAEKPWESKGVHAYGTILEHDGVYKMWYDAIGFIAGEPPHERSLCYATSRDGLKWEKPRLGIVELGGSRANNAVLTYDGSSEPAGVIRDAGQNVPKDERYKMINLAVRPAKAY